MQQKMQELSQLCAGLGVREKDRLQASIGGSVWAGAHLHWEAGTIVLIKREREEQRQE